MSITTTSPIDRVVSAITTDIVRIRGFKVPKQRTYWITMPHGDGLTPDQRKVVTERVRKDQRAALRWTSDKDIEINLYI